MKKLILIISLLPITITINAQQADFPSRKLSGLTGPYLGQKPPGTMPEIFAPGIVSTNGSDEWGLAVNGNCTEIFFSRSENDKASVFHIKYQSEVWSKPVTASFSGKFNDSHPVFFANGTKLLFSSKRPNSPQKGEMNPWVSEKVDGIWGEPRSLKRPFTDQLVHAAYVSSDGDIYASGLVVFKKYNSSYRKQEKLHPDVFGYHPAMSPVGDYIIFSNRATDGFGGTDLYVTFKKDNDTWSTPKNLGDKINTKSVESSPTISQDGKFLFFSRNGDIWWVSTKVIEALKQKQ